MFDQHLSEGAAVSRNRHVTKIERVKRMNSSDPAQSSFPSSPGQGEQQQQLLPFKREALDWLVAHVFVSLLLELSTNWITIPAEL